MNNEYKIDIKTVEELNQVELEQFRAIYIEYFKELSNRNSSAIIKLRNLLMSNDNRLFANEMIDKLFKGERDGLISVTNNNVSGFIVGDSSNRIEESISHYYLDGKLSAKAMQMTRLQMFKKLFELLKVKGINKVVADTTVDDTTLIDSLESLDFIPLENKNSSTTYEKRI